MAEYLKSFEIKNTKENDTKIDVEIIKLCKKARKYGFVLSYKKEYLNEKLKVSFCFSVPVIKYKDFEYIATLTRENPKLAQQNLKKKTVHMDTCTKVDEDDKHTIEDRARGNRIVCSADYKTDDFSKYFKSKFYCDHCGTNRFRLKVYLFRNPKGKDLMISTACSKEYFGVSVDAMLRNLKAQLEGLEKYCKKAEQRSLEWEAKRFNTAKFCKEKYDYMTERRKHYNPVLDIKPYDHKALVKFWKEQEKESPKNLIAHNINVALMQFHPSLSDLSNAVYQYTVVLYPYKQKEPEKDTPPKVAPENYKLNDRINDKGKILKAIRKDGYWGPYIFYVVRMDRGHRIGFSCSKRIAEEGDRVSIDGTVKNFAEWKGETTVFCKKVLCKPV